MAGIKIKNKLAGISIAALINLAAAGFACADSTVTIPVPDSVSNESKNLVLTITVPTALERTYQQQQKKPEEKPKKINYNKYFDMSPFPNMTNREEVEVVKNFAKKGIADNIARQTIARGMINNNYEMARSLNSVIRAALAMPPEEVAKAKVTRTDLLDLVKVMDNYTKELKMFGITNKHRDGINKLSQKLSFTDGEVKVVKVETDDIGSTVIHLTLNNVKGNYKPQYITKLDSGNSAYGGQTMEVQVTNKNEPTIPQIDPNSLQFSTGNKPETKPAAVEPDPNNNQSGSDTPPPPSNNNQGGNNGNPELPPPPPDSAPQGGENGGQPGGQPAGPGGDVPPPPPDSSMP